MIVGVLVVVKLVVGVGVWNVSGVVIVCGCALGGASAVVGARL